MGSFGETSESKRSEDGGFFGFQRRPSAGEDPLGGTSITGEQATVMLEGDRLGWALRREHDDDGGEEVVSCARFVRSANTKEMHRAKRGADSGLG